MKLWPLSRRKVFELVHAFAFYYEPLPGLLDFDELFVIFKEYQIFTGAVLGTSLQGLLREAWITNMPSSWTFNIQLPLVTVHLLSKQALTPRYSFGLVMNFEDQNTKAGRLTL